MKINDIENFSEEVIITIKDWFKTSGFKDRKLTDTPTDSLQVVNKKYVDTQNASIITGLLPTPGTSGNVLTSNGSVWTSAVPTGSYGLLDRVSLSSPATTLNSNTFTAKKYLRLIFYSPSTSQSKQIQIRFNGDTGNNYGYGQFEMGVSTGFPPAGSVDSIALDGGNRTTSRYHVIDIYDTAANRKQLVGNYSNDDASGIGQLVGVWINAGQITSAQLSIAGGGATTMATGTELTVLGMD